MTERAQALEAANYFLDAIDEIATIGAAPKGHVGMAVQPPSFHMTPSTAKNIKWNTREIRSRLALLAVQPPPPVGSPTTAQADDVDMVNALTAICRAADQAFQKSGGSSRHWVRDCFLPRINAAGWRVVPESTPVEPAGASEPPSDTRRDCTCLGTCKGADGLSPRYRCALSPAPVSPVEPTPEPPTEDWYVGGRIDKCPDPRCGCSMEHSPDCAIPVPRDLVRYGVTWPCVAGEPLLTPMPDGYWTPWHLAVETPTGAPTPCVWRERDGLAHPPASCSGVLAMQAKAMRSWRGCPYCLRPLTVER
jgi:hypothetical protein